MVVQQALYWLSGLQPSDCILSSKSNVTLGYTHLCLLPLTPFRLTFPCRSDPLPPLPYLRKTGMKLIEMRECPKGARYQRKTSGSVFGPLAISWVPTGLCHEHLFSLDRIPSLLFLPSQALMFFSLFLAAKPLLFSTTPLRLSDSLRIHFLYEPAQQEGINRIQ